MMKFFKNEFVRLTILNKVSFLLLDIGYVLSGSPQYKAFITSQALSLLCIPLGIYFFPLLVTSKKKLTGFLLLCVIGLLVGFAFDNAKLDYVLMIIFLCVFICVQLSLQRYFSVTKALLISTLHILLQILYLAKFYVYFELKGVVFITSIFTFIGLMIVFNKPIGERKVFLPLPFSINVVRMFLMSFLRIYLVNSSMPALLIVSRLFNQAVSFMFTAIFGKKSGVNIELPKKKILLYFLMLVTSLTFGLYYQEAAIFFTVLISLLVLELSLFEAKKIKDLS